MAIDPGVAVMIGKLKPKGSSHDEEPEDDESDGSEGLEASAQDILDAVDAKDAKGLSAALRDFFMQCDAEPHEEGPHEDEAA